MRATSAILVAATIVAAGLVPLTSAAVVWTHPAHALTPEMNATLTNNTALAQSFLDTPPVGSPLAKALAVAERALLSRRNEVSDGSELSLLLRRGIDVELGNVATAATLNAVLTSPSLTPREKALEVAREGMDSRESLLGISAVRTRDQLDQQRRALDLVSGLTGSTSAIGIAREATTLQASALDLTLPDLPPLDARAPSAALTAFMDAKGVPYDAQLEAELQTLDNLPYAPQLQRLIDAYARFDAKTQAAFGAGDHDTLQRYLMADEFDLQEKSGVRPADGPASQDWDLLAQAGVDVGPILAARNALLSAAADLRTALATQTAPTATQCAPRQAPLVGGFRLFSIDLTDCANTYTDNVALTIDWKGNDVFTNNAGGNRLDGLCEEPITRDPAAPDDPSRWQFFPRAPQAAALFDFGGDDVRRGKPCGFAGGAALGAALLVDFGGGNDVYEAQPEEISFGRIADGEGTTGGGHAGVGMLIDDGGSDVYRGGAYAVNGGSLIGLGILVDRGTGADTYVGTFGGVNGGANIGAAFLFDGGGNDLYVSDARSGNGGALAGAALLIDLGGNDVYRSVEMAQPRYATATLGGVHFGVALLYDEKGDDIYEGLRDGVLGGAIDGVGLVIDVAGHDRYSATYNGTLGSGWSLLPQYCFPDSDEERRNLAWSPPTGLGMFVDLAGDDVYRGHSFATIGGAYIAAGFFVDGSGNDDYYAADGGGSIGAAGGHNTGAGVAFLFDGGGDDTYKVDNVWSDELTDCPLGKSTRKREFDGKGAIGGAVHKGGVGFLVDVSGADTYIGNSTGVNGGAADGAIGMLIDATGDDTYRARDRGVNGGAYSGPHKTGHVSPGTGLGLHAMGFLVDGEGNDKYFAGGNDSAPAAGIFRDTVGHGVNGGAHRAMGFLYDGGGVDRFVAWGIATNGGGAGGVGFLFNGVLVGETAMSDRYDSFSMFATGNGTMHASNGGVLGANCATCRDDLPNVWHRQLIPGGIGLLVDMGGSGDAYQDPEPTNVNGRNYSGDGYNVCVVPKGEPGLGQQRDLALGVHQNLQNGCASASGLT
ncbi:MAG TPA: hypothetical protein VFH78_05005 [Candidatus Thermoplasmatota archaeon]|nr:hypothetical protein [Candidatus Thermoplasmatota archaeon]